MKTHDENLYLIKKRHCKIGHIKLRKKIHEGTIVISPNGLEYCTDLGIETYSQLLKFNPGFEKLLWEDKIYKDQYFSHLYRQDVPYLTIHVTGVGFTILESRNLRFGKFAGLYEREAFPGPRYRRTSYTEEQIGDVFDAEKQNVTGIYLIEKASGTTKVCKGSPEWSENNEFVVPDESELFVRARKRGKNKKLWAPDEDPLNDNAVVDVPSKIEDVKNYPILGVGLFKETTHLLVSVKQGVIDVCDVALVYSGKTKYKLYTRGYGMLNYTAEIPLDKKMYSKTIGLY